MVREGEPVCPDPSVLEALLMGRLDASARAQLESHLDRCPSCGQVVAELARIYGSASWGGPRFTTLDGSRSASPGLADTHDGHAATPPFSGGGVDVEVGRYRLGRRIGAGGMGMVFEAHDPELHRNVAIKLLHPGVTEDAEATQERLLREARAMARLAHPNVVAVHDVGRVGEQVFIAMELVEGTTLRQWLAAPRTRREILDVFVMSARGLQAAHDVGLVHRDFKPDNVLIGADGRARVTDFGLARPAIAAALGADAGSTGVPLATVGASVAAITTAGAIAGTPAYMAPEQWRGQVADARSDQFSLCVALYEALFGRRPFAGTDLATLGDNVLHGRMLPPATGRAPGWLRAAVLRGLALDPGARFGSLQALVDALQRDRGRVGRIAAIAGAMGLGAAATVGVLAWMAETTEAPTSTDDTAWGGVEAGSGEPEPEPAPRAQQDPQPAAPAADDASQRAAQAIAQCVTSVAEAKGRYQPTRRRELVNRVHGVDDGNAIALRTMPVLDAWAKRWTEAAQAACGEPDAPHAQAKGRCLDLALGRFDALVAKTMHLGNFAVEASFGHAAHRLPELERCTNEAWLTATPPAPDEALRGEVASIREGIASVDADLMLRQYGGAPPGAAELVARAQAIGYAPVLAEAQLLVGRAHALRHEPDEAVVALEAAAATAAGDVHPQVQARASVELVAQHGALLHGPVAARWVDKAQTLASRLGGGELEADLLLARGRMNAALAHHGAAGEQLQRDLDTMRVAWGDGDLRLAEALVIIADARVALGQTGPAQRHAERARTLVLEAIGGEDLLSAEVHAAVARVALARGDLAAAETAAQAAEDAIPLVSSFRHDNDHAARWLLLGDIRSARGDLAGALKAYDSAEAYVYAGPPTAWPFWHRGQALLQHGKTAEGLAQLQTAVTTLEGVLGEEDPRLLPYLSTLGRGTLAAGKRKASRAVLERAATLADTTVGYGPVSGMAKQDLAELERAAGHHEVALKLFDDAHVPVSGAFGLHHRRTTTATLSRADLAWSLGQRDYARRLYGTLAEELEEHFGSDDPATRRAAKRAGG